MEVVELFNIILYMVYVESIKVYTFPHLFSTRYSRRIFFFKIKKQMPHLCRDL